MTSKEPQTSAQQSQESLKSKNSSRHHGKRTTSKSSSSNETSTTSAQEFASSTTNESYSEKSAFTGRVRGTHVPSSHPIQTNSTTQILSSNAATTPKSYHDSYTTYEEAITSGVGGLGIVVSPYLQHALNDRHGEHSNRVNYQDASSKAGPEVLRLEEYGSYQPIINFVNDGDNLPGDLVGIGAQFENYWDGTLA